MLEPEREWRRRKGIQLGIVLRLDDRTPWKAARELIRVFRSFDCRLRIPFETEAPGFGSLMRLDLHAAGADALPLDLLARGATGVSFE